MTLRVKKFDPSTITAGKIIFLLGRRESGKSHLMKELLYYMSKPDLVVAMSPTRDSLDTFATFLPKTCIFDRFSQQVVDTIVVAQRELVKQNKKRTVLLILDDCIYQKGVLK
jgi:ABC-type ATPase involved in cell division